MIDVRAAQPSIAALDGTECETAALVLARAFRDNPLNRAAIASDDPKRRLRANLHGLRTMLPGALAHGEVLVAHEERVLAGVLVAMPPGAYPLPFASLSKRLRCLLGQGFRVAARWSQVFEALDGQHPREPCWYLGSLGIDPGFQGRGIGSRLLGHWLARVDQDGGAASYLETDVAANVDFYARAGFAVEGEVEILGARIWRMRRPPREAAISTATPSQ